MNVLNRQNRRIQRKLANLKNLHPLWVRTVAGLAAVVMFFTVYSLILPAAAATGDQAMEESGFFLEESTSETDTKVLAEAKPMSGGEAAQEAESPSGSSEEGSTVQQESGSGSGESGSSAQPETLQAETSGSGSGWESIPQDNVTSVEAANTDNSGSTASGSGQNGTEEFVVSEQETNKSAEAAAVTEETVSETASQKTEATTEEITEETSEELSEETEEEEEEPVYTNTIETEDEKTGIKAKIVFGEEIVRDTDKLVLAAASDKKSDKEIVIPLDALEKGIAERCAEIVSKDLDDEEKKSADDIETVKAEFVGLTIEDKDGEEVSLPANTRMRVEIVFPGSYETEEEEYQCVLMAEQSAKDYQDQLEKKAADDELVVSMEKLKADVSKQDQADGGKTVVSFETKELNSAGIVVFRVSDDDVEEASSDESEVSEESSETSSEETSDESAETTEDVTDESSDEISESKETVSEDALAEVSAESADEVTSESEEAASEEDETVYEAGTLKADGGDYHITMSYTEDAKIPAGARLEVRELQERTREFNKLIGQYNKEFPDAKVETESSSAVVRGLKKAGDAVTGFIGGLLGIEKAPEPTSVQTARLFDITILDENGKEIEPSGTVQVDIQLDALQQVAKESDITLVHFEDKVNEVDASLSGETLSFETDSFSVYGVMYTVDFEYTDPESGETYKFTMPGGGMILLSELVDMLGIIQDSGYVNADEFLANVQSVEFTDGSLIRITRTEEDWQMESLQSFDSEETLTIVTGNGRTYFVTVTDPATQDISGTLTDVSINATQNADGSYTVYAGQAYGIDLSFKEQPSGTQFDMENGFYYDLPSGLFDLDSLTGKTMIELSGGDQAGKSVELDYRLEGNRLVFSWPDQSSDAYKQLKDAIYTHFKIRIEGKFQEDAKELVFSDDITKNVDVKTDGKAEVSKNGTYNPATNSIDYTVYVTSTGICKDVVVTDSISGTALTYNNDAVATSNKNQATYTPAASGNGFTFTIPQMGDGETITVKYSAKVNLDALTANDDGTLGTVEQTGNKVTVKPSNHPGDEDEKSGKDLNNKISYSTISKSSSVGETGADGHATVTWTIKANENANVSMAGHTISDMIATESQGIMKYIGTGITVVRKNADGTAVGTAEIIPWENLTSHSDSAWTWTVPNADPDSGKLSYEITYTTDVDVNGKLFNTVVKNTAESDNGGNAGGSGTVGPVGGPLAAHKVYISKDTTGEEKTVTWEVNFDVPAAGLDSAEIDDTLPVYWNGSSPIIDDYKEGSVTISPELAFGDSYEISTYTDGSGQKHMKVTFHKTVDGKMVTGLSGTGSKRKVRVQFKTVLNEEWLEAAKTDTGAVTHTNNANVILNGQTLGTQASVKIDTTEPSLSKSHGAETVNVVNGNTLPAWQFYITLTGISDDTFDENGQIVIQDTYNSKYLDWYPHAYPSWEQQNGQVFGGDSNNKFVESSTGKVLSKVADGQLRIVLNQGDLPRNDDGDYYPLYTIPYYLTVKDPIAKQKLIAAATNTEGGFISLYNTASNDIFGETEDKVDYEVPVVDKTATEPVLTNGVYKLHYTIDVNKNALQLGDNDELVMTDEYSNISIDYTTVKIYEYINGAKTEVNDVVWDRSGYTATYYLKNATHYVIEYDAHLSGEGEKISDKQYKLTYSNTAEVFGRKSTWEKEKTIDDASSGGSRTFRVKVLKHVKGNASKGLEGAVFQLWWYPANKDDPAGKDNRPEKDAAGWENTGKTLVTDANGYASTTSDMQIHSQTWYKLVEVKAPEGYTIDDVHYFFWITEKHVADYDARVYLNDDVLAINNLPELPETVDVTVEKTWDDNSNTTLRKDINVHLYAEGQPYNEYFSGEWAADAREDADVTLHLNEDGTSETYTWEGLPSGYTYSVVEDPIPGYTTTYSPKNTLASGTLKITNKRNPNKTAISVDKVWGSGTKPSEDVTIQLKRKVSANASIVIQNGANNAGAGGGHITDYAVPAGATVNLIWTYKNSWGYDSPALNIYNYGTKKLIKHYDKISGTPLQHTVEATVPPEGIIVAFEEPYLSNLDDFKGQFDFDVQVKSAGSGEISEDINFTNERHYYTLKPDENWHLDIDNLILSDDDGSYTYYVEEVGVNDNTQTPKEAGYEVKYTNNEGITDGTITVTNEKETPGKVRVQKSFTGIDSLPAGFKITNNYNDDVFTLANASGKGTVDDPYVWQIEEVPAGTEVTFTELGASVSGYALTITANGTVQPEGSITAAASATAAKQGEDGSIPSVQFVNEYEQEKGSLKIRKSVKENGSDPVSAEVKQKLAGSYTFTLYTNEACTQIYNGKEGTPVSVTVEVGSDGAAAVSNEVSDLPAGDYWIKETLPSNDSMPVTNPVKVTVEAGKVGDEAVIADFVNNYQTTNISVRKEWSDSSTVDHTNDTITFKLYQVAETDENEVLAEKEYPGQYTGSITGSGVVDIENLPVKGTVGGKEVNYHYYVAEYTWKKGYVPSVTHEDIDGGQKWQLMNIGPQNAGKQTSISVTKKWFDKNGNDVTLNGHNDDNITFKLVQTAVESDYVPVVLGLYDSDSDTYSEKTYYVKKHTDFNITVDKPATLFAPTGVTISTDDGRSVRWPRPFFNTDEGNHTFTYNITEALTIRATLYNADWSEQAYNIPLVGTYWSHTVSGTNIKDNIKDVISESKKTVTTQDYVYTLRKDSLEGSFTPSAKGWVGTVADLPQYKKTGDNSYSVYSYSIDEISVNGKPVTNKVVADEVTTGLTDEYSVEVNHKTNVITNSERPQTDVEATKAWLNADGSDGAPANGKVTFELYADGAATGKTVELDGTVDPESSHYESGAWKALWKGLPKYSDYDMTQEISYTVKEITGFAPYVNQNPDGITSGGTITNKEASVDLEILKVDKKDRNKELDGAIFTLRRIESGTAPGNEIKYDGDVIDTKTTGDDGKAKFVNISSGYYEVKETKAPVGYVFSEENAFYIKVDQETVHMIQPDLTKPATEWSIIRSGGIVSSFVHSTDNNPAIATVINEPGASLPSTGGHGTKLFTILGCMLIALAGVLVIRRRRLL